MKSKEENLIELSEEGNLKGVKKLIEDGADVNAKDKNDATALMWAAYKGHTEIVKFLLSVEGINVNSEDEYESTALIIAARNGHDKIVKILKDHGAKEQVMEEKIAVNAKNKHGRTALMYAANNGDIESVNNLLSIDGIDVNAKDNDGYTALIYAAKFKHSDVVKILLKDMEQRSKKMEEENTFVKITDENISDASCNARNRIVKFIKMKKDVNNRINLHDRYGQLMLHTFLQAPENIVSKFYDDYITVQEFRQDTEKYVRLFLENGADPYLKDYANKTALDYDRWGILKKILEENKE